MGFRPGSSAIAVAAVVAVAERQPVVELPVVAHLQVTALLLALAVVAVLVLAAAVVVAVEQVVAVVAAAHRHRLLFIARNNTRVLSPGRLRTVPINKERFAAVYKVAAHL